MKIYWHSTLDKIRLKKHKYGSAANVSRIYVDIYFVLFGMLLDAFLVIFADIGILEDFYFMM